MLCLYLAFGLSLIGDGCLATAPVGMVAATPRTQAALDRLSLPIRSAYRSESPTGRRFSNRLHRLVGRSQPRGEAHLAPSILGKWCNDHQEVWIFGPKFLTHRRPGNTHRHRVKYNAHSDRITVYVDDYPDVFRQSPNGLRMRLESSGLDASMQGWKFWRCPDLYSFKQPTI